LIEELPAEEVTPASTKPKKKKVKPSED